MPTSRIKCQHKPESGRLRVYQIESGRIRFGISLKDPGQCIESRVFKIDKH